MSTSKVIACIVGIFFAIIIVVVMMVSGTYNGANKLEKQITKLHKSSENELATLSLKALEISGVARASAKDQLEYMKGSMQGRYGADGSKATMQWIKENNPKFDNNIRIKVAEVLDGGRDNFKNAQKIKLDACAGYSVKLDNLIGGTVLRMMGFPKIDMSKQCEIITSNHAKKAFETGIDEGIQGLD